MKEEGKKEQLEDMKRIEEEKKENTELKSRKKSKEDLMRQEINRILWESYHKVLLSNSISRSFTFSYFPKLRAKPRKTRAPETELAREEDNNVEIPEKN